MSLSWIIIISSVTLTSTDFHFPIAVAVIGVLFFFSAPPRLFQNYILFSLKRNTWKVYSKEKQQFWVLNLKILLKIMQVKNAGILEDPSETM